jgi:hypothetical protein
MIMKSFACLASCSLLFLALSSTSCRKEAGTAVSTDESPAKGSQHAKPAVRPDHPPAAGKAGGGAKGSPVADIANVESVPDLNRWMRARIGKGVLSEGELKALSEALDRIAKGKGIQKHEAVAELLSSFGEWPESESFALIQALREEPLVFVKGAEKGLSGRTQRKAVVMCLSDLSRRDDVASLGSLYGELAPGPNREQLAGYLAASRFRVEGAAASLKGVEELEFVEERRSALIDLSNEISEKGVSAVTQAELEQLYALADAAGIGVVVKASIARAAK